MGHLGLNGALHFGLLFGIFQPYKSGPLFVGGGRIVGFEFPLLSGSICYQRKFINLVSYILQITLKLEQEKFIFLGYCGSLEEPESGSINPNFI